MNANQLLKVREELRGTLGVPMRREMGEDALREAQERSDSFLANRLRARSLRRVAKIVRLKP